MEMKKKAKLKALEEMKGKSKKSRMEEMMDKLPMKKVTVASDTEEGLEERMSLAQQIMEKRENEKKKNS